MNQETYNKAVERLHVFKKLNLINDTNQTELSKYIEKLGKLLDDEYRYGSSWLEVKFINDYVKKCEEIIHSDSSIAS